MKLEVTSRMPGRRLLWTNGETSYLAKGMRVYCVDQDGRTIWKGGSLGGPADKAASIFRASRQMTRSGIHHLCPIPDGGALVIIRKRVYRMDKSGRAEESLCFERGNKPAQRGVCVTPDGRAFLAEYALNPARDMPVVLYASDDSCRTFRPIFEFKSGSIRHIHFIQWDDVGGCLWMGTGDRDEECWIYRSRNLGETWDTIGGGSQSWRAIGLAFRPEAVYWGTDAGSDAGEHPNHVMRLDRSTLELDEVIEVQGPCHGVGSLADGTLVVGTGVEGGINEKDRSAHLWASRDGDNWEEVASFEKDGLPPILQYGVIRFPPGLERSPRLAFTAMGLRGAGETVFFAELQ